MNFSFPSAGNLLDALRMLGVSETSLEKLEAQWKLCNLKANETLLLPGEINTSLYYVLEGGFACRFISEDGEVERAINFYLNELHPVMACVDSYFSQTPTRCELRAIAASTVLVIPKDKLDALMAEDLRMKSIYDALLMTALVEENDLKLKIISCKPDVFYQYLLREYPVIIQKIPSRYIAELMGISAEWLSKLKSKIHTERGAS